MQLNVGGNSDFLNMLERERLESKKISKTNAVTSMLDYDMGAEQRPRRPVRLRAVAHRPQVGLHPHGGQVLRRRAAEHRAQARGLGLAELGRNRDRRRPAGEARAGQRRRRRARGPERLPDEVTAEADPGRRRPRRRRALHQAVRRQDGEAQRPRSGRKVRSPRHDGGRFCRPPSPSGGEARTLLLLEESDLVERDRAGGRGVSRCEPSEHDSHVRDTGRDRHGLLEPDELGCLKRCRDAASPCRAPGRRPRYTRPALAADDVPNDWTETSKSSVSPTTTSIGSLVHVGEPCVATLPPVPLIETLRSPWLPPSLYEAVPAPVLEPHHEAGSAPPELSCSNEPFCTLLPLIVK